MRPAAVCLPARAAPPTHTHSRELRGGYGSDGDDVRVVLDRPVRGIAPGQVRSDAPARLAWPCMHSPGPALQAVVFYWGDVCLGHAIVLHPGHSPAAPPA
jgi:hypothetical protein